MQEMRSFRAFVVGLSTLLAAAPSVARAQQEAPKGWLGVLITTGIGQRDEAGRWVFNDYPVIESIDPGSPAERAGLLAGDILISINRQDFKLRPIPMASLLVPGQRVVFRFKRNDETKTSAMTVAERPAGTSATVQVSIIGPAPSAAERARVEEIMRTTRTNVPVTPSVSIAPLVFGTGTPSIAIAGAELTRLNEDLRQLLKVNLDGLFVVNVVLGSPAEDAGLRGGDVIVRAADQELQNPGQLIRMMELARDRVMKLQIVRRQKPQNIVLRW
jgi:S1-C subfamily serine protease